MKERPEILRPEQLEAVDKMKNGCILNGGVGSGKSRTSLYYWYYRTDKRELYIITTAAKRDKKEWIAFHHLLSHHVFIKVLQGT